MQVLIVDDVHVCSQALAAVLGGEPSIDSVATAAGTCEGIERLGDGGEWVVLLNMNMVDSSDVLSAIVRAAPTAAVIAMAVSETEDAVITCAEGGVAGYITRGESLADLVAVIARTVRGETHCSPRVAAALLRRVGTLSRECRREAVPPQLTAREREVLELLDEGLSNKQIARRLSIELRTVKNHVHHILEKFQVHRRGEAAALFRKAQVRRQWPAPSRD